MVAKNKNHKICGVLCIDVFAYQINFYLSSHNIEIMKEDNLVEFSRFVVVDKLLQEYISLALMAASAEWAYIKGYSGIIAMTRSPQKRYFSKFGLSCQSKKPFSILERKSADYWILKGDWPSIESGLSHLLTTKFSNP